MGNLNSMATHDSNNKKIKIKATSAEIIVRGSVDTPYYGIKYQEVDSSEYHIGYGSYNLKYVFEWLEDCFEIVNTNNLTFKGEKCIGT